jgi:hypothetical protein
MLKMTALWHISPSSFEVGAYSHHHQGDGLMYGLIFTKFGIDVVILEVTLTRLHSAIYPILAVVRT